MKYVGIDWAGDHHDVAVTNEQAEEVGRFQVAHTVEGLEALSVRLATIAGGPSGCQVAIDDCDAHLPILIDEDDIRASTHLYATQRVFHADDAGAEFTADLAAAYPAPAGVEKWRRSVRLDRAANSIVVRDQYALRGASGKIENCALPSVATPRLAAQGTKNLRAPNAGPVEPEPNIWDAETMTYFTLSKRVTWYLPNGPGPLGAPGRHAINPT